MVVDMGNQVTLKVAPNVADPISIKDSDSRLNYISCHYNLLYYYVRRKKIELKKMANLPKISLFWDIVQPRVVRTG